MYIHEQIPVNNVEKFDDDICQAIFCVSPATSYMFACVYKPCDATDISFSNMLQFLNNCFHHTPDSYKYTKLVLGDLNFPNLWKADGSENIPKSNSEQALINFMNDHFLCQYIDIATRENNILDLFLTNNDRLVQHLKSDKLEMSDHNIIEIFIPYDELTVGSPSNLSTNNISTNLQGFNALDLFKADYNAISADLEKVDWDSVWSSSSLEEFPEKLRDIVLDACKKHSPPKTNKPGRLTVHDRSYRSLMRKKKKLNTRLKCISSINPASPNINKIEKNLKEK